MIDRDRDRAGRANNARPRDELGRPLPKGSAGVERIPDDLVLPPAETLRYAQELLNQGRAFSAHEVLEAAWKNGPTPERELWQGLAQLAVGVTHVQRGNISGAIALLNRGAANLSVAGTPVPHNIDAAGLREFASDLVSRLSDGELPASISPRLTTDHG